MSRPRPWPRRRILQGILLPILLRRDPASAQSNPDRGIGGTGAILSDPQETAQDRGIGGTGVIGTIRRFGSIVVNDLRITFPRSVKVRIDDRTARLRDLKLGHVVQLLARQGRTAFETGAISVVSEVVGPIEALTRDDMTVLGQTVVPTQRRRFITRWKVGDVVAVSGLRRLDGVIMASLIERRRPGTVQIAGFASEDGQGGVRVGALAVVGLDPIMIGQRILASGRLSDGALVVERATVEPSSLLSQNPARLLIEDYVARDQDGLRLGSGLSVESGVPLDETPENTRAIVAAEVRSDGRLRVQAVQPHADPGQSRRGRSSDQPGQPGIGGGVQKGLGHPGAQGPGEHPGSPRGFDPSRSSNGAGRPSRGGPGPGSRGRPSRA